jgi:acyl-CoA oxidase
LTAVAAGLAAFELAKVDVGVATFGGILQTISMLPIYKFGSEEQKQNYLPKMAQWELVGSFCLTEPEAGSDASNLKCEARPDYEEKEKDKEKEKELSADSTGSLPRQQPKGWRLRGQKRWIGNGTWADVNVVWARDAVSQSVRGFVVETPRSGGSDWADWADSNEPLPGLVRQKIQRKVALRPVQNADLTFRDCYVADSQRLPGATSWTDGPAACLFFTRLCAAWIGLGAAAGAYEAALRYCQTRQQFERPLAGLQLVQEKLVRQLGMLQGMWLMCWRASSLYDLGQLTLGKASMCKAQVTLQARQCVALAREVLGGNGVIADFGVARHFVDVEAVYSYEGTYDINTL